MLEAAQVAAQCEFVVGAAERRSVGRLIESGPHPDKKVRAASGRTIETPMRLAPRCAHSKIILGFFFRVTAFGHGTVWIARMGPARYAGQSRTHGLMRKC